MCATLKLSRQTFSFRLAKYLISGKLRCLNYMPPPHKFLYTCVCVKNKNYRPENSWNAIWQVPRRKSRALAALMRFTLNLHGQMVRKITLAHGRRSSGDAIFKIACQACLLATTIPTHSKVTRCRGHRSFFLFKLRTHFTHNDTCLRYFWPSSSNFL